MGTSSYNTAASPISSFLMGAVICSAILFAKLPGGNFINLGVSISFVAIVLFNAIAGKRALWFSPELLILVAWLCYSMLGTLVAVDAPAATFKSMTMVQVLVLAFCVQQVVIWNKGNITNLVVYGAAVSVSYLLTFIEFNAQEFAGSDRVSGNVSRVASTLSDENEFGAVALMGFSLVLIALAQNTKKSVNFLYGFLLVLLSLAVINSGSRTALLGAILVLLGSIWAFRLWRGAALRKVILSGITVSVISVSMFFAAKNIPQVEERINAAFSADSATAGRVVDFIEVLISGDTKSSAGNSIDERVSMINDGIEIVSNHPFIGVGLSNFSAVSGAGTYAHSNVISVAVSTGLVGFIIYYMMYAVLTLRILRLVGRDDAIGTMARLALIGLMAYFLMDITRVSYYEKTSWLYFATVSALVEVLWRSVNEPNNKDTPSRKRRRRRKKEAVAGRAGELDTGFDDIDALFPKNT